MTAIYNPRPSWLANALAALDTAIAEAYDCPPNISNDDAIAASLALNFEREPV